MSIINVSVKRPISTIMFFVGVILLGFISLANLPINLLPDLSYPKITVYTNYPGLSPEEMEKFVTTRLEGSLSAIDGIKRVNSVSRDGVSVITLEFHWGTDMDFAHLHTKEKVEEARNNLPEDCPSPEILEMDPSSAPIIIAVIKSKERKIRDLKDLAEFIVKQRLEQQEGIARVEIRGGDELEISVEIEPKKIDDLGITLTQVAQAIEFNNIPGSGGTVKKDRFKYTLKVQGEIQEPQEIENIVVTNLQGRSIQIKDIGRAFYKNKLKQGDIRFNQSTSISLLIYRASQGNTVSATQNAQKTLKQMGKEFDDLDFFIVSKEADLIISSINSLKLSLMLGAGFAFFVLLMFLQNYRDPILVSLVIPIAVISTFVLMFFFEVSVNIMSLGGLVLGVGMFVDNSIIVLEAIFRHRKSENLITSVIEGAKEVSGAITASTFTTISIFLPVIYLYGITGKLFKDQALTVSFSLISSLIVAITLLPALSSLKKMFDSKFQDIKIPSGKPKWFHYPLKGLHFILMVPFQLIGYIIYFVLAILGTILIGIPRLVGTALRVILNPLYKAFNRTYASFDNFYHKVLESILDKKVIALLLAVVVLASIWVTFGMLDTELLPAPQSAKFEIKANTLPAYGFEETDAISQAIETQLRNLPEVEYVYSESGDIQTISTEDISVNSIHLFVKCKQNEQRDATMEKARQILKKSDLLNFSVLLEKNSLSQYLATSGENFKIKVFYETIANGKKAVLSIVDKIQNITEIHDLKTTTSEGKPIYAMEFNDPLLQKLNISKNSVASFVKQAVRGESAGVIKKTQKQYDIYVRVPTVGIMEADKLKTLPVSINNQSYFVQDLIKFKELPSIKEISREAQERFFLISGDVKGSRLDPILAEVSERIRNVDMPPNTRYLFAGEEEERKKAFDSLNQAILLAIVLVYMVMAAKFENIFQPFIIMLTVPMGIIGAFIFLLLSGNTLNIISGIGIMVLIGIGVNDAIVKIEYANQLRADGMGVREAIMKASQVRLRPILMTTFTTICGLIPMALIQTTGSELQQPLAWVVVGGLFFTTLLTLIFIPVCYELLENLKNKKQSTPVES